MSIIYSIDLGDIFMAHLSSKTSDGRVSFEKYISQNPKWHSGMKFVVENGTVDAPLIEIKTNKPIETKITVNQGDVIHIMSKVYKTIKKKRYTKIRITGSSGIQGYLDLKFIRKPTSADVMKTELAAIRELDSTIRKIEVPITIVVDKTGSRGKYEVKDIVEARKIGGTPKADLALFNKYGVPVFWISHKKEGDASAFQQYSGVSAQSGTSIYQHKESKSFMKKVIKYIKNEKLSIPLFSRIKDPTLRRMAIYGPDVKFAHKFGQNNVQMIGQGNPILEPVGFEDVATLRLSFSSSYKTNEDVSGLGGDYEPVFVATYRAGRGFSVDNKSYKGARLGIAPYAMVKNRKGIKEV